MAFPLFQRFSAPLAASIAILPLIVAGCAQTPAPLSQPPVVIASNYVQIDKDDVINLADVREISFHTRTDNEQSQYPHLFTITIWHRQSSDTHWIGFENQVEAKNAWHRLVVAALENHRELVPINDSFIINVAEVREIAFHSRTAADAGQSPFAFTVYIWDVGLTDPYWIGYDNESEARTAWDHLVAALHPSRQ